MLVNNCLVTQLRSSVARACPIRASSQTLNFPLQLYENSVAPAVNDDAKTVQHYPRNSAYCSNCVIPLTLAIPERIRCGLRRCAILNPTPGSPLHYEPSGLLFATLRTSGNALTLLLTGPSSSLCATSTTTSFSQPRNTSIL